MLFRLTGVPFGRFAISCFTHAPAKTASLNQVTIIDQTHRCNLYQPQRNCDGRLLMGVLRERVSPLSLHKVSINSRSSVRSTPIITVNGLNVPCMYSARCLKLHLDDILKWRVSISLVYFRESSTLFVSWYPCNWLNSDTGRKILSPRFVYTACYNERSGTFELKHIF